MNISALIQVSFGIKWDKEDSLVKGEEVAATTWPVLPGLLISSNR